MQGLGCVASAAEGGRKDPFFYTPFPWTIPASILRISALEHSVLGETPVAVAKLPIARSDERERLCRAASVREHDDAARLRLGANDLRAMRLAICTGNPGKVSELRALLPPHWELLDLSALGLPLDLPENGDTLEANALEKARFAYARTGVLCLADDTGLEVAALAGDPGVRSARYAGEAKDAQANTALLLERMHGSTDRSARFRTVIALVGPNGEEVFEGVVQGAIASSPAGSAGFGYDPVFIPQGGSLRFAEMDPAQKNRISHRAVAVSKLIDFLNRRYGTR